MLCKSVPAPARLIIGVLHIKKKENKLRNILHNLFEFHALLHVFVPFNSSMSSCCPKPSQNMVLEVCFFLLLLMNPFPWFCLFFMSIGLVPSRLLAALTGPVRAPKVGR